VSNYNLLALDDKEFEALGADLIGTVHGVRVERFKPGKDAGVDGRWYITQDKEAIVQCKHWMRSGYAALLKHLANKEKAKIDKLKPARYILATSVELSRQNKRQIASVLSPHVRSGTDILGFEDIEGLLSSNTEIEKRHYKLWLASAAVLDYVFNNAIIGRSNFDAEAMREKIPLVVKTKDFENAADLLEKRHTVIITGVPGIGKTTLAEQLIVHLLAQQYELVSMRDITEGEAVYSRDKKQLFYFDDFLGRNMLEALKLQHDSQIVGFIKRVLRDKLKRFVLTSRSSILNQGKQLTDLFGLAKTDKNEYEVQIEGLSRYDRARILYSHIWHSTMPEEMLDVLFAQKRYKTIADHRNYNPRLIAFITDSDLTSSLMVKDYWEYVTKTLENPQDIWDHFFSQLSQDCRDMAYLVVLSGKSIPEHQLRLAVRRIRPRLPGEGGTVDHDATVALKICTGSVLNRRIDAGSGAVTYDLYNPSIADYVFRKVIDWAAFADFFAALRTVGSLRNLREMRSSKLISEEAYVRILDLLASKDAEQPPNDVYTVELCEMLLERDQTASRHKDLLSRRLNELEIGSYAGNDKVLLRVTSKGLKEGLLNEPNKRIGELCERAGEWSLGSDEFHLLANVVAFGSGEEGESNAETARQNVLAYWKDFIEEFIVEADILRGVYSSEDYAEGRRELKEALTAKLQRSGFSFDPYEIDEICETVSMYDVADRNREGESNSYSGSDYSTPTTTREIEDQMIDDLFERDRP
jgi:hypothetical protein